jgi:hypothetical protein
MFNYNSFKRFQVWFGLWCLNNILVISWRSVSLVEETEVPGEYHRLVASHWQTLSHILESSTPRLSGFQTHNVSGDRHNFEMGPPKDHPSHILLNLVQWFQRKRFKCERLWYTTVTMWWQKLTWPLVLWAKNFDVKNGFLRKKNSGDL